MVSGWQEEVGDLVALLRVDIQNSGETRPKHGAKFDHVHPYQAIVKKRRRALPKGDISVLKALLPKRKNKDRTR